MVQQSFVGVLAGRMGLAVVGSTQQVGYDMFHLDRDKHESSVHVSRTFSFVCGIVHHYITIFCAIMQYPFPSTREPLERLEIKMLERLP